MSAGLAVSVVVPRAALRYAAPVRSRILDLTVFLAVLAAAVMHAGWNVMVKLKLDRFLSLCLIQTLMGVMGLGMLAVFPWPDPA